MLRKHKQIVLLVALFLSGTVFSMAQEPQKLSLQEAVNMAMQYNTSMMNSKLDVEIAHKKIWETTAMGLPHVDITSAYTFLPKVPSIPANVFDPNAPEGQMMELGVKNQITGDLTASQLIFNGAYIVGLQATKVYYDLTLQNNEKTKLDVIESVINTYHMIQITEEGRKVLVQNLENIEKTLYEIGEMNKQGFVEKTDVDQLEVTANSVRNAISQIDSNLEMAYRLLKIQLGMQETGTIQLADELVSNDSLTTSSLALVNEPFTLENNVDYKLILSAQKIAKLNLKLAKSDYYPTLNGYYRHSEKLKSPFFDFAPKDMLGINLSLPIFSSGERSAKVAQKKYEVEKSENTRVFVSNSLVMQANQYQSDLKIKLEKLQIQKKTKDLSDRIYQTTLEKYKEGLSTSTDLLTAQNQYLSNLTTYFQNIGDVLTAKSKLEKLFNINQDYLVP
jgi:outer membrane protein TolC